MTDKLVDIGVKTWGVLAEMAPYLLFGFLMAGLLAIFISPVWIERHLGRRRWWSALKAALFGVPLPLCSCGVIPVSASLRRHGASKGAVAAFLMSTPQTGVDSILVTWGLLGPVFAIVRPIAAFLSGTVCGVLVDRFVPEQAAEHTPGDDGDNGQAKRPAWVRILRHGFVVLAGDVHKAMLAGVVISGILGALLPANALAGHLGPGWTSMLLMMLVGIPLYVCSSASVPIALGLIHAGVSPGAALVFLITGPATNAATISVLFSVLGRRTAMIYLGSLVVTALGSGILLDRWLMPALGTAPPCFHAGDPAWWQHAAAAVLLAVLFAPFIRKARTRG